MARIDQLLLRMQQLGASDLILTAGERPKFRIDGEIKVAHDQPVVSQDAAGRLMLEIVDRKQADSFHATRELEFVYQVDERARFRAAYCIQRTGYAAVFRYIPMAIQDLAALNAPDALFRLADLNRGLVLIAGPPGSGKTTTLAAVVDHINTRRREHLLILEDPIEYLHPVRIGVVSHRQIGVHTPPRGGHWRPATWEDADVVVIGEVRDLDTASLLLTTAAAGKLAIGTINARRAHRALGRLIAMFPHEQRPLAGRVLSEALAGICTQQLIAGSDGGLLAAYEVIPADPELAARILDQDLESIPGLVAGGQIDGVHQMDDEIAALLEAGKITGMSAYEHAFDRTRFEEAATAPEAG